MRLTKTRKILIPIALLVLAGIVFVLGTVSWEIYSWRSALGELRAAGEPIAFADILAARNQSDEGDEKTIASVLVRVGSELDAVAGSTSLGVLNMERGPTGDVFTGIPVDELETTRRYLDDRRAVLDRLNQLPDLSSGRFNVNYQNASLGEMSPSSFLVPSPTAASRLLGLRATLHLVDAEIEAAGDIIAIIMAMERPYVSEPDNAAHLIRMALADRSSRLLECTLRVGTLREESLRSIDEVFARFLDSFSIQLTLQGERARYIQGNDNKLSCFLAICSNTDRADGIELLQWLLDAGEDPAELQAAARRIQSATTGMQPISPVAYLFGIAPVVDQHLTLLAKVRATRVAIAAERYRLETGRLPENLTDLVPAYMDEVPLDPFTASALRMARDDDRIVIYSVGLNGTDDGGEVAWEERSRTADVGFRLFTTDKRGLVVKSDEDRETAAEDQERTTDH